MDLQWVQDKNGKNCTLMNTCSRYNQIKNPGFPGVFRLFRLFQDDLAGIRTQDPRIKSALLYRLSYEVLYCLILVHSLSCQPAFGIQRRHAPATGRSDRLPVVTVRNITRREDSLHGGFAAVGFWPDNVAL